MENGYCVELVKVNCCAGLFEVHCSTVSVYVYGNQDEGPVRHNVGFDLTWMAPLENCHSVLAELGAAKTAFEALN
jgi:hypothetical protein